MTRYEQELRKLFDGSGLMDRPQYSGRVCVGELGKDLRVRAEFFSAHVADQYDAIRLTVLNRKEGVVDRTLLQFKDVWGKKPVPSNPNFRSGVMPHLWDDHGDVDWYVYHPSAADYDSLRQAIGQYLSMFRERTPEWAQDGPKLVFICAPLRDDVEKNIEFARAEGPGGVRRRRYPHLSASAVSAHHGPKTPGTGQKSQGDVPAAFGVLPAAQCLRTHLDR